MKIVIVIIFEYLTKIYQIIIENLSVSSSYKVQIFDIYVRCQGLGDIWRNGVLLIFDYIFFTLPSSVGQINNIYILKIIS